MKADEIKKRVQEIRDLSWDNEAAHMKEDELYGDFIEYVANCGGELGDLAKEVLETENIRFSRWYA